MHERKRLSFIDTHVYLIWRYRIERVKFWEDKNFVTIPCVCTTEWNRIANIFFFFILFQIEVDIDKRTCLNVINNKSLVRSYEENIKLLRLSQQTEEVHFPICASTDMGNVSYKVVSIHPMFCIGSDAMNHTREFTSAAGNFLFRLWFVSIPFIIHVHWRNEFHFLKMHAVMKCQI
jgi:hypothetical protein